MAIAAGVTSCWWVRSSRAGIVAGRRRRTGRRAAVGGRSACRPHRHDLGGRRPSVDSSSRADPTQPRVQHAPWPCRDCKDLTDEALLLWKAAGATIVTTPASHLSIDAGGDGAAWGRRGGATSRRAIADFPRALQADVRIFSLSLSALRQASRAQGSGDAIVGHPALPRRTRDRATSEWLLRRLLSVAIDKHRADLAAEIAMHYVDHMVETLPRSGPHGANKGWDGACRGQITLFHVISLAATVTWAMLWPR